MPELYGVAAARADCHFPLLLTKCHPLAATWPKLPLRPAALKLAVVRPNQEDGEERQVPETPTGQGDGTMPTHPGTCPTPSPTTATTTTTTATVLQEQTGGVRLRQ